MPNRPAVPDDVLARYEFHEWRQGLIILAVAHPQEWEEILEALRNFQLLATDILKPGGSKTDIANKFDRVLLAKGWKEKTFDTRIT
jgi:hypothetical protein